MKRLLLAAATVASLSGAASAQVAFQFGTLDFTRLYSDEFSSINYYLSGNGRGDYNIGNLGMQLDGGVLMMTDPITPFYFYSAGIHIYKPLVNGTKLGAYASIDVMDFSGRFGPITPKIYGFGVESITRIGPVEIEAYIGRLSYENGFVYWLTEVDVFYELSDAFELSAGVTHFFDGATSYSFGATYTFPNSPVSLGADYAFDDNFSYLGVTASYALGAPTDERLFQKRGGITFFGP